MVTLLFFFFKNTTFARIREISRIFIDLQIEDNYKYITKFEENVYLLASIFWDNDTYPVIVRRHSYSKEQVKNNL